MSWKSLLCLPAVALAVASAAIPNEGPDRIGDMSYSEFAIGMAFLWLFGVFVWRTVRKCVDVDRRKATADGIDDEQRGFEVIPSDRQPAAGK